MTTIRPGRADDLAAVTAFASDTFAWGDYVPDAFVYWLEQEDQGVLVAVDEEDQPIALVHARQMSEREGWISGARVSPEYRRRGVGTVLNEAAVEWLQARGALIARLTTEEDNVAARAQVQKLGYRAVARFIFGQRAFVHLGKEANGGRRLPANDRFDLAPSAEAEAAFIVFQSGELARLSHGLYAPDGWDFRRLAPKDLISAARRREFWTAPSGWAVTSRDEDDLWVGLLVTVPEDAGAAARALVDLAEEQEVERMELIVPRLAWLEVALEAEHIKLGHPNVVYELTIG